jgi:hypothetical protein
MLSHKPSYEFSLISKIVTCKFYTSAAAGIHLLEPSIRGFKSFGFEDWDTVYLLILITALMAVQGIVTLIKSASTYLT